MCKWLILLIKKVFYKKGKHSIYTGTYLYHSVILKDKIPDENSLKDSEFVEVVYSKQSYWAVFKCPCKCGNLISLPLQKTHNPHWRLERSFENRPTLYPSIWQNKGCLSHFWIVDGRIEWCGNTGIEPWIAEPMYYPRPTR